MYKQQIRFEKKKQSEAKSTTKNTIVYSHIKTLYKILFKNKRVKIASKPPITSLWKHQVFSPVEMEKSGTFLDCAVSHKIK